MDDDLPLEIRNFVAKVTSIFESNAFRLGDEGRQNEHKEYLAGIFPIAARFNHSCCPNVAQTWNGKMGMLTMHAIRRIEVGEELCEGYVSLTADRGTRQKRLAAYDFECTCEACEMGSEREERRARIRRLENELETFNEQIEMGSGKNKSGESVKLKQEDALGVVTELEGLLKEEGLVGHDLLRWYECQRRANIQC